MPQAKEKENLEQEKNFWELIRWMRAKVITEF